MIQFYFLSIFFNVLAGYVLVSDDDGGALEIKPGFSLKDETAKLVLGILSMATGVLKLLSSVEGDLPVVGDIIPAVTGFAAGFVLVFEYYKNRRSFDDDGPESVGDLLNKNKKILGFLALISAALHFLFPKVLLL
jgi:purine-cytosine permease-like protein